MSDGPAPGTHLDLDALADVLAGDARPDHLAGCAACRGRLADLEAAMPAVSAALGALPAPELPEALPARLTAAVRREGRAGGGDVLPLTRPRTRWLPALAGVAAAAAAVVGGGVLLAQHDGGTRTDASSDAADRGYAVSSTGTDYSRTGNALQTALPALLKGDAPAATEYQAVQPAPSAAGGSDSARKSLSPAKAADALAPLRTTNGLATCLASLTDPGESGLPLALDYATFEGKPALVVVLPGSNPTRVEVFVVPAGCAQADGDVLYFRTLPKP